MSTYLKGVWILVVPEIYCGLGSTLILYKEYCKAGEFVAFTKTSPLPHKWQDVETSTDVSSHLLNYLEEMCKHNVKNKRIPLEQLSSVLRRRVWLISVVLSSDSSNCPTITMALWGVARCWLPGGICVRTSVYCRSTGNSGGLNQRCLGNLVIVLLTLALDW